MKLGNHCLLNYSQISGWQLLMPQIDGWRCVSSIKSLLTTQTNFPMAPLAGQMLQIRGPAYHTSSCISSPEINFQITFNIKILQVQIPDMVLSSHRPWWIKATKHCTVVREGLTGGFKYLWSSWPNSVLNVQYSIYV